jgi:hypothetical protein
MASGGAGPASQNAEELTAPPEGMYWVQMQGLWALRPVVDLDYNREREHSTQPTERPARSTLEQQRASSSNADRQWLSQTAGAACSAAALTVASGPPGGEGSSRLEQLARMQGVLEFHHEHAQSAPVHSGPERPNEANPTALVQQGVLRPPQAVTGQLHPTWPEWFLQWGRRVENDGGSDHAPDSPAPPSAPPSPPGTPQRSMVKSATAQPRCQHPHSSRSPPSQGGRPLGPRGEPLALRWRSRGSSGTLWAGKWPDLGRTEPPTSLLLHCALDHHVDHPGSRNSTASGSTPSAAGGAVAEPVKARAGRSCCL